MVNGDGSDRVIFEYIYDCGAKRNDPLYDWIDYYADTRDEEQFDALILSHLHQDHVSGVPRLIKKTKPQWVFLPLLPMIERLLILAEAVATGADREVVEMIADPGRYFLGRGSNVVFVGRGEGGPDFPPEEAPDSAPEGPGRLTISAVSMRKSDAARGGDGSVFETTDEKPIHLNDFWAFIFYCAEQNPSRFKEYQEVVEDIIGIDPSNLDSKRIFEIAETCRCLWEDPKKRRRLIDPYRSLSTKSLNRTSLSVYSGRNRKYSERSLYEWHVASHPVFEDRPSPFIPHRQWEWVVRAPKVFWLGTGDAELRFRRDADNIIKHYQGIVPPLAVCRFRITARSRTIVAV